VTAPFLISYVALWVVVLVQAAILIGVTRALYELRAEYTDEPSLRGRRAPQFSAVDLWGRPISSESIAGKRAVLLFVSPDCSTCMVTLSELKPLVRDGTRRLVVVCGGKTDDCLRLALDHELTIPVVADEDGEIKSLFAINGTPMAVRISAHGVIESHGEPARGEELEQLLAEEAGTQEPEPLQIEGDRTTV
jgi:peroxiredoxin